jgi:hypothetical protein
VACRDDPACRSEERLQGGVAKDVFARGSIEMIVENEMHDDCLAESCECCGEPLVVLIPLARGDRAGSPLDLIQEAIDSARSLERGGWAVKATVSGLVCVPPEAIKGRVVEVLRSSGIDPMLLVPGISKPGRAIDEIEDEVLDLQDRVEYEGLLEDLAAKGLAYHRSCGNIEKLAEFEEAYGFSGSEFEDDYDRGFAHGKLAGLKWAMGFVDHPTGPWLLSERDQSKGFIRGGLRAT